MKRWLSAAVLMLCLLTAFVFAEEAAENVVIYFNDGSKVLLPAEITDDEQKLAEYCNQYFPGRFYSRDAAAAAVIFDTVISQSWAKSHLDSDRPVTARLVKLGVHTSVVADTKGEEMIVPTAELTIRGFDDQAHHVAVISAPRTGTASLREKAAGSGKVLANCAAGRIVAVVEYTNASFTKILYEDTEGYIRTDCLIFQNTAKDPAGAGTVHVNGTEDGQDDVIVRNTASKSSSKVASVPTGTTVFAYAEEEGWYIVEGDGWLGYIPKDNLRMDAE